MNKFESHFNGWLRPWQSQRCDACGDACGDAMQDGIAPLSGPELDGANKSLNNLYADTSSGWACAGGDCDYSLPGTGPLYTGHWHGKRVHDGLSVLLPLLPVLSARPVCVIDIGAGTGAALWAWTLLARCAQEWGSPLPVHSWYSIDCSQSMLKQSDRLWGKLCRVLPNAPELVNRQPAALCDWRNHPPLPTGALVVGSYLFARADLTNPAATAAAFVAFLTRLTASGVVLWTKPNKCAVQDGVKTQLVGWIDRTPLKLFDCALQGQMRKCLSVAQAKFVEVNLPRDPEWNKRLNWGCAPTKVARLAMTR